MVALAIPTGLAVVDDGTGVSLTASAVIADPTLFLRFYYGKEFSVSWDGYVERSVAGSGSKQITGLTFGQRYAVTAVSRDSGLLMSAPTLPLVVAPSSQAILNNDSRNHMRAFIEHALRRSTKYTWHKKLVSTTVPSRMVNVPFAGEPLPADIQYNENVRVADQPNIFQNRGLVPIVRQRTGGMNKADIGFADVKFGDFTAFCPIDYGIDMDDRLIHANTGEEYKVVHSTPHENGLFRHLELKWLSGR